MGQRCSEGRSRIVLRRCRRCRSGHLPSLLLSRMLTKFCARGRSRTECIALTRRFKTTWPSSVLAPRTSGTGRTSSSSEVTRRSSALTSRSVRRISSLMSTRSSACSTVGNSIPRTTLAICETPCPTCAKDIVDFVQPGTHRAVSSLDCRIVSLRAPARGFAQPGATGSSAQCRYPQPLHPMRRLARSRRAEIRAPSVCVW